MIFIQFSINICHKDDKPYKYIEDTVFNIVNELYFLIIVNLKVTINKHEKRLLFHCVRLIKSTLSIGQRY